MSPDTLLPPCLSRNSRFKVGEGGGDDPLCKRKRKSERVRQRIIVFFYMWSRVMIRVNFS